MCLEIFEQLVLHVVLLAPGRSVPIGANMFGIFVPMGMLRAGARSIHVENNMLIFLYFLIESETRVIEGASPFSHMRDVHYRGCVSFQLVAARFRSLVPPRLLELMPTSF
jgi:hypothetical protein